MSNDDRMMDPQTERYLSNANLRRRNEIKRRAGHGFSMILAGTSCVSRWHEADSVFAFSLSALTKGQHRKEQRHSPFPVASGRAGGLRLTCAFLSLLSQAGHLSPIEISASGGMSQLLPVDTASPLDDGPPVRQALRMSFVGYPENSRIINSCLPTARQTSAASTKAASTTFYVSSRGNDAWSGQLASPNATNTDGPFRGLDRAQAAMRASSCIKMATIEGGVYSIAHSSLSFSWEDSGETWLPYKNMTPTIDGGGSGYIDVAGGADKLTIERLTFSNLGVGPHGAGMYLSGRKHSIRWNTFLNSTNSAISGSALTDSIVDSNRINGQGPGNSPGSTENGYAAIQLWYGSTGNRIAHNLIENTQGGGIQLSTGPNDPPSSNNIIDRNRLSNVDLSTFDNGALYIYDPSHRGVGNRITNNIVQNNGAGQHSNLVKGIYLDDDTSNVVVSGNVLWGNVGQYGLQIHGGDNNTIENNIFQLSSGETFALYQDAVRFGNHGMRGNIIRHNIVYYSGEVPQAHFRWLQDPNDTMMAPPTVKANLYYSLRGFSVPHNGQITDSNPVYANPQFTSPASGDFSMPSTSPAYTAIGWQILATDQGPLAYPF